MDKLHAVLLKKRLTNENSSKRTSWKPHNSSHWLAFGHFDDIYTYQVDNSSDLLTAIKLDKKNIFNHNDDTEYYHPLYLVPYEKPNGVEGDSKWFIAIIRIHFASSINLFPQFDKLYQNCYEKIDSSQAYYQMYHATEFSDAVLDIRCNNFKDLLDIVFSFRKTTDMTIGKMYTYFGVNYNFLNSPKLMPVSNDVIELFSMRFSGYNMDVVQRQLSLIEKHITNREQQSKYCINGIDDIMLICTQCPTDQLISLFRDWSKDNTSYIQKKADSSTRVGIEFQLSELLSYQFKEKAATAESALCAEFPDLCKKISSLLIAKNDEEHFGWVHAILEVANSLVRMSKTPVMDEVVYLIAPGLRAFLLNFVEILNNPSMDEPRYSSQFYSYAESCSYYIEQLMRVEGQLSHNPEIRPVIYDIPVFMLEYTVAFLNKVSALLMEADLEIDKCPTEIFLVPHPCERASTDEIFPASKYFPGLVHIQIPESVLYEPDKVFRALCHEVSHYVGETHRSRKLRKETFVFSAAALLTDCVFESNDESLTEMFENRFLDALSTSERPTMLEMHSKILSSVAELITPTNCTQNIWKEYVHFTIDNKKIPIYIEETCDHKLPYLFKCYFAQLINDLENLYKEVFADICMIYFLDIPSCEYIHSLLNEMIMYPTKEGLSEEIFAIRIFTALYACGKEPEYCGEYKDSEAWSHMCEYISWVKEDIEHGITGLHDLPIPMGAIWGLMEYALGCYKSLSSSLSNERLENIRNMYNVFSRSNVHYTDILSAIDSHRQETINRYSHTES